MKRILLILTLVCLSSAAFAAKGSYKDFSDYVTKDNLKHFAKDMGGLMGANTFTTGRVLGWGGFQVGPRASAWFEPNEKNTALGDPEDVGVKVMPWIQADIGFPWRIDGFIRASSYDGLTVAGGGFRWGIFRPVQNEWSFQTMIVLGADAGVADSFSMSHYHASLVLSMTMKHFTPYISAGVDHTNVKIQDSTLPADLNGTNERVTTPRYTAGLNFKLPFYLDLSLAGNWAYYGPGAEASFTLRF
ncbi:hypothetical protein AAIR98_001163 [Elusimicrobium simillimum]|uniref:hypothetical protein n=1 Tax=Elusimicrobium simillimum TaxID=3143438 RepID=UPI003C6F5D5D